VTSDIVAGSIKRTQLPVVDLIVERLTQLPETHYDAIQAAAELFAGHILRGNLIHVFGAGHSHMLAEEVFYRAGGLLSFNALLDPALMLHISAVASGQVERIPDYALILLDKYPIATTDAILVISYSGINPVPVEVARICKNRGLKVVALTSIQASYGSPARHHSGQRLCDVADIVLDNPGPVGDAALHISGLDTGVCGLSTILGATILQSVVYETIRRLHQAGHQPPLLRSTNTGDDESVNEALVNEYRHRLQHL
jgi:uncharacterized phosphosugar-binding protein